MTYIFLAYWEICLNEYMSIWHSIWTHPGCILCPRRTHTFGNECQTSCCEFSGILFVVDLVEGKAHPCQAVPLEFEDLDGKTMGLLLRMMKIYIFTGRYVMIDYGLCVLKGLIQIRKKGIACSVIKNRRY